MGGDGDSVHYNPQDHKIVITYDFVMEVRERFKGEYKKEWELYAKYQLVEAFRAAFKRWYSFKNI